jgi:hypothetical protein|uniref:Uncharacterized protein n=1 Tax=Eutreptiella gymnastica TaxID=73025 RepID=A0A7S4LG75_9EUGL
MHGPLVFILRRAIGAVKKWGYKLNLECLDPHDDAEYLAVAPVEFHRSAAVGLTGRPSLVLEAKHLAMSVLGLEKRLLLVMRTKEGVTFFLVIQPEELDDTSCDLLEEASLDFGFATDRGISVITLNNSQIFANASDPNAFVFKPTDGGFVFRDEFHFRVLEDGTDLDSVRNSGTMRQCLTSLSVPKQSTRN